MTLNASSITGYPRLSRGTPLPTPSGPRRPPTQALLNTQADILLQQALHPRRVDPPPTSSEEVPDTTAPAEEEEPDQLDTATSDAFGRLLAALNNPRTASPILDDPLYTVLSRLSHAHPWSSLILDLKELMPDLDKHYHTHLLVALLQPGPRTANYTRNL